MGVVLKRQTCLRFEKLECSRDIKVKVQFVFFFGDERARIRFVGQISNTFRIRLAKTPSKKLTRGERRQISNFRTNGPAPDFGFGRSHTSTVP